ncbi:lysophospholipid acyltransferase family protein [Pseudorhodoplanes sp.]|uniref:lysophospholipid acyltransferase family protein n=1 Tax=Pseudorhodoplanes sp. TaxID=1934341 RepID=UPI003D10E11A
MLSSRRLARARWVQKTIGILAAEYLRFVNLTSRTVTVPGDIYERAGADLPVIVAMWHGQHFMAPFIKREGYKGKTLISRHRDGEMNAVAAEWLGIETIRGSGDHGSGFHRKGGVSAYFQMLEALAEGYNVALTADVPKVSRVAGPGIIRLARDSGRPIYPVALASSRRKVLDNWDRSAVNLPFSLIAGVVGDPVRVDADASDAELEAARQSLETALNAATERAYAIADGKIASGARG